MAEQIGNHSKQTTSIISLEDANRQRFLAKDMPLPMSIEQNDFNSSREQQKDGANASLNEPIVVELGRPLPPLSQQLL